jgi:glycerophosphoryl diester phosphodiesterase
VIVLSHRGYWLDPTEKNSTTAFRRSFDLGFGLETDVRDCRGELVISHDMPGGQELKLDEFLAILRDRPLPLAVNIKADGLASKLASAMQRHAVADWFVFDMAVPDMLAYFNAQVPVFTRMSEVEPQPILLEKSSGIWLDSFYSDWFSGHHVDELLDTGKRICIVSPELHGRCHESLWELLLPLRDHPRIMLCTDLPEKARGYFK